MRASRRSKADPLVARRCRIVRAPVLYSKQLIPASASGANIRLLRDWS
jgi:hypothetical protein